MIKEIKLPEISENVESGSVVNVLVSQGQTIAQDDPIIELETDKAAVEVPASDGGKVTEILVSQGDEIKVGQTILKVETEQAADETASEKEEEAEETESVEEESAEKKTGTAEAKPAGGRTEQDAEQDTAGRTANAGKDTEEAERVPVPAAPSTRRLAREIGVAVEEVSGTGPGGRITTDDVKRHAKNVLGGGQAHGATEEKALPDFSVWGETYREPTSRVRQVTAENTRYSWQTIPHVTQLDEADVTDVEAFRKKHADAAEKAGGKLTVTAILLKIVATALRKFPRFNASLDMRNREIVYKKYVNVGIAVDTDRGLLVPVVRDADRKSIVELSAELSDLASRTRNKKIKPEEMDGGNFTISNLGGIGGTSFTPVVFSPQVAILGVARAETKPVYSDGEFTPRLILPLSLSYDHRVIDGADGARFLHWICTALSEPLYMDLEAKKDG